ncbi:hypothetical protein [Peterkaempfera bronchialis]|uniref:Uncharacterized protein n=1 Tax=Peterkaempfera bronchialis TaxID=2126346 RepID=A0A345SW92_9ACTN|nr:hypothetical protein [Peterkaempfera bronchialis]AXI77997.1 hypothetical protein C7M71_011675 [Peterkaempfera bronchialis]
MPSSTQQGRSPADPSQPPAVGFRAVLAACAAAAAVSTPPPAGEPSAAPAAAEEPAAPAAPTGRPRLHRAA